MSLSARRAWIEIWAWGLHGPGAGVALRKESVDRNLVHIGNRQRGARRSPQGERG